MRKCPFCFNVTNNSPHIYKCKEKPIDVSKEEVKYLFLKYNFPEISKLEVLKKCYIDEKLGLPQIKEIYGIDYKSILSLLEFHEIKKRCASEAAIANNPKRQKTCYEKYGAKNVLSSGTKIFEKRNATVVEKYGVDNVFQIPTVKGIIKEKWHTTKTKRADSMMERYGWVNAFDCPDVLKKALKNSSSGNNSLQKKIKNELEKFGIQYELEFLIEDKRFYYYDIKINDLIVELNGDYWHANPTIYSSDDLIPYPGKQIKLAKDIWKQDEKKKKIALERGYRYVVFWETEINKNFDEVWERIIDLTK